MRIGRGVRIAVIAVAIAGTLGVGSYGVGKLVTKRTRAARLRDAERAAPQAVAACREYAFASKVECYRRGLTTRLGLGNVAGVAGVMATLDAIARLDPDVAYEGHVFAHGVGIEAYLRFKDVPGAFLACGDGFASGCRHGVIQAYLEARPRVTAADINALCAPFDQVATSNWVFYQCLHGMGHGLTMLYSHDLPRALIDCDSLSGAWHRDSCYSGAFMENIVNATAPHHPASELAAKSHHHTTFKALDPADPLYPCTIVPRRQQMACYLVQTSAILAVNHGDIPAAGRACDQAPERMRSTCYMSLGRDISSFARRDTRESARLCGLGGVAGRPHCYAGVVKSLVDWTSTTDSGFAFCRGLDSTDVAGRRQCYFALGEQISALTWTGVARSLACRHAEEPAAIEACREGAKVRGG